MLCRQLRRRSLPCVSTTFTAAAAAAAVCTPHCRTSRRASRWASPTSATAPLCGWLICREQPRAMSAGDVHCWSHHSWGLCSAPSCGLSKRVHSGSIMLLSTCLLASVHCSSTPSLPCFSAPTTSGAAPKRSRPARPPAPQRWPPPCRYRRLHVRWERIGQVRCHMVALGSSAGEHAWAAGNATQRVHTDAEGTLVPAGTCVAGQESSIHQPDLLDSVAPRRNAAALALVHGAHNDCLGVAPVAAQHPQRAAHSVRGSDLGRGRRGSERARLLNLMRGSK